MRSGRGRKQGRAQARDKVAGETETEGVGWVSSEKKNKKIQIKWNYSHSCSEIWDDKAWKCPWNPS